MSHHAERGNIFKRKGTTKMKEYTAQELLESLEFEEVLSLDKDGFLVVTRVY